MAPAAPGSSHEVRHRVPPMIRAFTFSVSISAFVLNPALAQEPQPRVTARQAAELMAAFGPEAVNAWRANEAVPMAPSSLPPERQSRAANELMQSYGKHKAQYSNYSDALQWGEVGVGVIGAAAVLYGGPQALITVPVTLGAALLMTGLKVAREEVDAYALAEGRKLLADYAPALEAELGTSYDQIRAEIKDNPQAVRERFMANGDVLRDLRQRSRGDPLLEQYLVDTAMATIANTTAAQLAAASDNSTPTATTESKFIGFVRELREADRKLDERLGIAEAAIDAVEDSVSTLQVAVADIDERVGRLGADQAIIADFVFDQMPAAEKVRRLQGGFMSDRFVCPAAEQSCEASELKESLIARYQAEADFNELVSDIATVAGTLNDINTIAVNLGVDLPKEVDMAVGVANIAVAALSASTGLGAIAAVSGLASIFGGSGSDADAERHRQMMAYLGRRFDAIDKRLTGIIENQAKIMTAIVGLSEQMQRSFASIDRTLARIEYGQGQISQGVKELLWAPWKSCYQVYSTATALNDQRMPIHVDTQSMVFKSEDAIRAVINETALVAAIPCFQVMQPALTGNKSSPVFGIINLRLAVSDIMQNAAAQGEISAEKQPSKTASTDPGDVSVGEWRTRLMAFDQDIFEPALVHARTFIETYVNNRPADAFVLLARPVSTSADWRAEVALAAAEPFTCIPGQPHRDKRLCPLLSPLTPQGFKSPDQQAVDLLERPILADVVVDLTAWVILMAQITDRLDQVSGDWIFIDEQLDRIVQGKPMAGAGNGERLIEGAIDMLDIAIASYAMTYGPLSARIAADAVLNGKDLDTLINHLEKNAYLASNTAQLVLEDLHREFNGTYLPPEGTYRTGYEEALKDDPGRFLFLKSLFGPRAQFATTSRGAPGLVIVGETKTVAIPLPPPAAFRAGRFTMPKIYADLLAARSDMADRLYGYRMLDDLEPEDAEAAALALLD